VDLLVFVVAKQVTGIRHNDGALVVNGIHYVSRDGPQKGEQRAIEKRDDR
jgi:hypothetical protein